MNKGSLNMFMLGVFALSSTPIALLMEQQYYFGVPAFLIGLCFQTVTPLGRVLIKGSKWYRHSVFFVYPSLCVVAAILGYSEMEFTVAFLLLVFYWFWSIGMSNKILQQYFGEEQQ